MIDTDADKTRHKPNKQTQKEKHSQIQFINQYSNKTISIKTQKIKNQKSIKSNQIKSIK